MRGMRNASRALALSVVDLFHPKIFLLLLVPPILSFIFWGGLAVLYWNGLSQLSLWFLTQVGFIAPMTETLSHFFATGADSFAFILSFVMVLIFIFPLAWITSLLLVATLAMPVVLRHLSKNHYPHLEKKRGGTLIRGLFQIGIASLAFLVLWVVTLPLWLIPGLGALIHPLVASVLYKNIFSY